MRSVYQLMSGDEALGWKAGPISGGISKGVVRGGKKTLYGIAEMDVGKKSSILKSETSP